MIVAVLALVLIMTTLGTRKGAGSRSKNKKWKPPNDGKEDLDPSDSNDSSGAGSDSISRLPGTQANKCSGIAVVCGHRASVAGGVAPLYLNKVMG